MLPAALPGGKAVAPPLSRGPREPEAIPLAVPARSPTGGRVELITGISSSSLVRCISQGIELV
jgi:hypothetical protein